MSVQLAGSQDLWRSWRGDSLKCGKISVLREVHLFSDPVICYQSSNMVFYQNFFTVKFMVKWKRHNEANIHKPAKEFVTIASVRVSASSVNAIAHWKPQSAWKTPSSILWPTSVSRSWPSSFWRTNEAKADWGRTSFWNSPSTLRCGPRRGVYFQDKMLDPAYKRPCAFT